MKATNAADKHHQPCKRCQDKYGSKIRLFENTDGKRSEDENMGQKTDRKFL